MNATPASSISEGACSGEPDAGTADTGGSKDVGFTEANTEANATKATGAPTPGSAGP